MTFIDWVRDSAYRFKTQPPTTAAKRSSLAFARGIFRRVEPDVIPPVWSRDWDVLIILDACRVDQMEAVEADYDCIEGVDSVWSQAACSIDWINKTFNEYPDHAESCAYVTANPFADNEAGSDQSADLENGPVGYLNPLYKHEWQELTSGGVDVTADIETRPRVGSSIATVPPETVTDYAIKTWREREQLNIEKMIVHYMQPHEPYLTHPEWGSGDHELLEDLVYDDGELAGTSVWKEIQEGSTDVNVEQLWQAGVDNLHWAMDDIQTRLVENMDAEIALSADHGNAMGEWGEWHHPPGAIAPTVRKVPWVEVDGVDKKSVNPDVGLEQSNTEYDVEEQLEMLGYR